MTERDRWRVRPRGCRHQPHEQAAQSYHAHILHDPRHCHCQVLSEGPGQPPSFEGCSMKFFPAQAQDLRRLLAPVAVSGAALLVPRPHTLPEMVELLLRFTRHGAPARHQLAH